ncbi:type II secretion system protein [Gilvimarinus sp. SDUM040013]|uniref:Type II secretion system protein n=1 Tax=Gilvimarinus gilvus TaxID=3058038 RepID=A0ABU4RS51_9GAMM|nr:type II secretion system protein [Gilvimarinus sp. SDUM040013]MDO3388173.1 type II secretion system protein [Gilvimarinus sp. SDUM040013]MDX6847723.1 type II secretion system protein [Gilvimarinus sp. SDUM040013]
MKWRESGFTLIELIAIIVILGVIGTTASSRFTDGEIASVQASRDDLVAALFFAQQLAMARDNIQVTVAATSVNVTENGTALSDSGYPLNFASGVTASAAAFNYDKLGRTNPTAITLTSDGTSATVNVSGSGYAY